MHLRQRDIAAQHLRQYVPHVLYQPLQTNHNSTSSNTSISVTPPHPENTSTLTITTIRQTLPVPRAPSHRHNPATAAGARTQADDNNNNNKKRHQRDLYSLFGRCWLVFVRPLSSLVANSYPAIARAARKRGNLRPIRWR